MKHLLVLAALFLVACAAPAAPAPSYAIVVSAATAAEPGWAKVVETLRDRHHGGVISFTNAVDEVAAGLHAWQPGQVCFVARPAEAGRAFVARVHELTRALDDDPYTDCFWGIVTGYDADAALRLAARTEPLIVRRAAGGTGIALDRCEEGVWYSESTQGEGFRKARGKAPARFDAPPDTTEALARAFEECDLFVTSGHATEHDWSIGYSFRGGQFRCRGGQLYGLDTQRKEHPIKSDGPKVYLPVGNCLMGHVDGPDAMALAFMNNGGVAQMAGYTVPTWYGYAGWGMLDYFVEQPGRFTLAEAFVANQQALVHRLQTPGLPPQDRKGLTFDRTVVAFYGDPAWEARMAPGELNWEQKLTRAGDTWTFEVRPLRGAASFAPVDANGSQRGGRPIIQFMPVRVRDPKIVEQTAGLASVVADDFLLLPNPGAADPARPLRLVFTARAAETIP